MSRGGLQERIRQANNNGGLVFVPHEVQSAPLRCVWGLSASAPIMFVRIANGFFQACWR